MLHVVDFDVTKHFVVVIPIFGHAFGNVLLIVCIERTSFLSFLLSQLVGIGNIEQLDDVDILCFQLLRGIHILKVVIRLGQQAQIGEVASG